jgi:hypothetical protein
MAHDSPPRPSYPAAMPRILMNFQIYKDWVVHFIQEDCRSNIGPRTRFFHFATEEEFRAFVNRCNLEDKGKFNGSMAQWACGSNYANLTEEQYARLKHCRSASCKH